MLICFLGRHYIQIPLCGEPLQRPSMQPTHGQPGPGQVAHHRLGVRCQLDRAVLLLQTDFSASLSGDVRGCKVRQVQLSRARPGAPSLGHERLVFPLPGHLVAVGGGGEGGDAPAGPGDRVPLHPPHPGVPLTSAGRHAAGTLPGPRDHLEDPGIFRPGLPGGVRCGRGLPGGGERSHLHFQVLWRLPVHERGGECSRAGPCPPHDHLLSCTLFVLLSHRQVPQMLG